MYINLLNRLFTFVISFVNSSDKAWETLDYLLFFQADRTLMKGYLKHHSYLFQRNIILIAFPTLLHAQGVVRTTKVKVKGGKFFAFQTPDPFGPSLDDPEGKAYLIVNSGELFDNFLPKPAGVLV